MLDKDFKQHWVAALRSGEYEQGRDCLRENNTFCCLGVACDIYDPLLWGKTPRGYFYKFEEAWSSIPLSIAQEIGLTAEEMYHLMKMNDAGLRFSEIANHIESQL